MSANDMNERRPIPGYEGLYEIDRQGNVYAMFAFQQWKPGRLNKTRLNPLGYMTTVLTKNGQGKTRSIHRLLMLTFNPVENSDQLEVNHIDGNRANNNLDNLEWCTHAENMKHSHYVLKNFMKGQAHGEQVGGAKLTAEKVLEIRRLCSSGAARKDLAQQFGVTTVMIGHIVRRRYWKHI